VKTLGPFIVQKNTEETLSWCNLTLGGNQNQYVWSISFAPFDAHAETFPATTSFTSHDPKAITLHAVDLATPSYFSLHITAEHTLLRFRPINYPATLTPFFAERYTGTAWMTVQPIQRANAAEGDHGYIKLRETLQTHITPDAEETCEARAKAQLLKHQQYDAWHEARQTISTIDNTTPRYKDALMRNGFMLALHDLKEASSSPLMYCYALIFMLGNQKKSADALTKLNQEPETVAFATALKRYLHDDMLHQDIPLDRDVFQRMQDLFRHELRHHQITQDQRPFPVLAPRELLSLKATRQAYLNAQMHSPEISKKKAHSLYILITNIHVVASYSDPHLLHSLKILLNSLLQRTEPYAEVYRLLEHDYHTFYPRASLTRALRMLLQCTTTKLEALLREEIKTLLRTASPEINVIARIALLLKTATDVQLALQELMSVEMQHDLLDALKLDNHDSPLLQTASDACTITEHLGKSSKHHLFKKRTPQAWGDLVISAKTLQALSKTFETPDRNRIFKAHAVRFAGFINSDDTLLTVLTRHITPSQLRSILAHVPPSTMQHLMQTTSALRILLTQPQISYFPLKVSSILGKIPSAYRVTALAQLQTPEAQANFLVSCRYSLCLLYCMNLPHQAWVQLFNTPHALRALAQHLIQHHVLGRSLTEQLIVRMPASFKQMMHEQLTTHASALQRPRPWLLLDCASTLEMLKVNLSLLLAPSPRTSPVFFQSENQTNRPSSYQVRMNNAHTLPELKTLLLKFFCVTQKLDVKDAVLEGYLLIQAFEQYQEQEPEQEQEQACDDHATPTKRSRLN
jgi:hypothetical protein